MHINALTEKRLVAYLHSIETAVQLQKLHSIQFVPRAHQLAYALTKVNREANALLQCTFTGGTISLPALSSAAHFLKDFDSARHAMYDATKEHYPLF